jgi:hypothetical protein
MDPPAPHGRTRDSYPRDGTKTAEVRGRLFPIILITISVRQFPFLAPRAANVSYSGRS